LRTPVTTDSRSMRLRIDADARLAAAVGGATRCLADAAGLENEAIVHLQSAVVAACQEAFEHVTEDHPHLDVTLTRLPDRIEVTLSHQGETSPAIGLDTIAGFATPLGDPSGRPAVLGGVDRVQYETQGSVAVTRLTKYVGQGEGAASSKTP
jgi:hypothetical protein